MYYNKIYFTNIFTCIDTHIYFSMFIFYSNFYIYHFTSPATFVMEGCGFVCADKFEDPVIMPPINFCVLKFFIFP